MVRGSIVSNRPRNGAAGVVTVTFDTTGRSTVVSTRRDRDIETIWCGDFGKLQALVALQGEGVAIERALEIGTPSLKTVVWASETHTGELISKPMQAEWAK